jgi:hypothetical protein
MKNFCEMLCDVESIDECDYDHWYGVFVGTGRLHAFARQEHLVFMDSYVAHAQEIISKEHRSCVLFSKLNKHVTAC